MQHIKQMAWILGALLLTVNAPYAGTVTTNSVPPTVDGKDIAMLNLSGSAGQGKFFNGEGFAAGQTFITDRASGTHLLNAVTIRFNGTYDPGNQVTEYDPTKTYGVRVVTIANSTNITALHDEQFVHPVASRAGDYLTFTFDEPFELDHETEYGFDVRMVASTTGWQSGIPTVTYNSDSYAEGEYYICSQYTDGNQGNWSATDLALAIPNASRDWVFHLDIDYRSAGTVIILK